MTPNRLNRSGKRNGSSPASTAETGETGKKGAWASQGLVGFTPPTDLGLPWSYPGGGSRAGLGEEGARFINKPAWATRCPGGNGVGFVGLSDPA